MRKTVKTAATVLTLGVALSACSKEQPPEQNQNAVTRTVTAEPQHPLSETMPASGSRIPESTPAQTTTAVGKTACDKATVKINAPNDWTKAASETGVTLKFSVSCLLDGQTVWALDRDQGDQGPYIVDGNGPVAIQDGEQSFHNSPIGEKGRLVNVQTSFYIANAACANTLQGALNAVENDTTEDPLVASPEASGCEKAAAITIVAQG